MTLALFVVSSFVYVWVCFERTTLPLLLSAWLGLLCLEVFVIVCVYLVWSLSYCLNNDLINMSRESLGNDGDHDF
jgi:hypothetical protein